MKCEICEKDIELKDAYSPIRYQIGVLSNPNQSMLARSIIYEFVCEECGEEIKRKIAEIKEIKPGYYGSKKYCPYCGSWHFVKSKNASELSLYDCTCGALFTGEYVTKYIRTKR